MTTPFPRRPLGATGLTISEIGLGTGGNALGLRDGGDQGSAGRVVAGALDRGITYIDTAPRYDTEEVVGDAVSRVHREDLVLSSKVDVRRPDGHRSRAGTIAASCEETLRKLRTDWVDMLFLHGVRPEDYDYAATQLWPELAALRDRGLVRAIGISESFARDPRHESAARAVADGLWDVVMVGFNVLNPSARDLVRPDSRAPGLVVMHAVRWALSTGARLADLLEAQSSGLDEDRVRRLGTRLRTGEFDAHLPAAAYAYALRTHGFTSVLMGTGKVAHLHENLDRVRADDPRGRDLMDDLDGLLDGLPSGSANRPA